MQYNEICSPYDNIKSNQLWKLRYIHVLLNSKVWIPDSLRAICDWHGKDGLHIQMQKNDAHLIGILY